MTQGLVFLVETIFSFFLFCILVRLIGQIVGLDYRNPLAQFVSKLTNPGFIPLRALLPRIKGFDLAGWLFAYLVILLKTLLLLIIRYHAVPAPLGLIAVSLPLLADALIDMFFYLIIIVAIASWLPQAQYHPLLHALQRLCEPVLAPARRIMPTIAGFDLSPMVVLVVLKLLGFMLINPLIGYTMALL